MTKLANNENATVEVMAKIYSALDCKMDDIIEIIPEEDVSAKILKRESSHGNCSRS
jgi:DNA-binding Xre family transcriptional regulator